MAAPTGSQAASPAAPQPSPAPRPRLMGADPAKGLPRVLDALHALHRRVGGIGAGGETAMLVAGLYALLGALVTLIATWRTPAAASALGELRAAVGVLMRNALPPADERDVKPSKPTEPTAREQQLLRLGDAGAALVGVRQVLDDLTLTALDATRKPDAQAFSAHDETIRRHAVDVLQHVRSAELCLEVLGEARIVVAVLDDTVSPPVLYGAERAGDVYDELVMVKWSAGPEAAARRLNHVLGGAPS